MKKLILKIAACLFIFGGVVMLAYPTVSNWLYQKNGAKVIENYKEITAGLEPAEIEAQKEAATIYNNSLTGIGIEDPFIPGSGIVLPDNYTSILDYEDGVMAYIEIPKIDIYLPIYHGTSEEVLEKGIGHMDNTAFPIGGENYHTVLTGHSGLTDKKIFTDLDKVQEGDVFYIRIFQDILAYEVDQILIVTPEITENLRPIAGEDYVTLVTCTPISINTHRLLIRGTRIPYDPKILETAAKPNVLVANWRILLMAAALLFLLIYHLIKRRRDKKRGG